MKFTGHERDMGVAGSAADDLDYMHARFYNPQVGRFVAFDPVGGNEQRPQSWNRYAYVLGGSLVLTDPFGLLPHPDCPDPCDDITVTGKDPYKAFDTAGFLRFLWLGPNRGNQPVERVVENLHYSFQEQFEFNAVEGNYLAAFLDHAGYDFFLPRSEEELGVALGMTILPGGRLGKLARRALGSSGRQANTLLVRLATRAGLEVRTGGKHLRVVDKTGNLVTTIPHSPHGSGTIRDIINKILAAAE
jgi:RHS repeat-associated protein